MKDFIIIGGGIAGLYTGYKLKQSGHQDILVLESNDHVGGRMHTLSIEGQAISTGAEFLLTTYKHTQQLIKALHIESEVLPMHHDSLTFYKDGKYYQFKKHHLLKSLNTKYLSWYTKLKLSAFVFLHSIKFLKTDIYDFPGQSKDSRNLYQMSSEEITPQFAAGIIDPMFASIFGYSASEMLPEYLYYAAKMVLGGQMFTFKQGIDYLPKRLAQELNVELNAQVKTITRHPNYVEVVLNKGAIYQAKQIIIAIPGTAVTAILQNPTQHEQKFFEQVEYKPITKVWWRLPHKLSSLKDHVRFADDTVNIRSINYEEPINGWHYYTCDLRNANALKYYDTSLELKQLLQPFLGTKAVEQLEFVNSFYWAKAIAKFTRSYTNELSEFLKHNGKDKQVHYVGDYISGSFIDGAMHSVEILFQNKSGLLVKD